MFWSAGELDMLAGTAAEGLAEDDRWAVFTLQLQCMIIKRAVCSQVGLQHPILAGTALEGLAEDHRWERLARAMWSKKLHLLRMFCEGTCHVAAWRQAQH
jgi:hypothetical protein